MFFARFRRVERNRFFGPLERVTYRPSLILPRFGLPWESRKMLRPLLSLVKRRRNSQRKSSCDGRNSFRQLRFEVAKVRFDEKQLLLEHAELTQSTHPILGVPGLHNLAVFDLMDVDDLDVDLAALFADENKEAAGQRHNVEQENGWTDVQAEP
jgi:hypothetical protein